MNKDELVAEMLNTKAENNNTVDLNAYGNGLADMYDRLVKLFAIPAVVGQSEQCCEPVCESFYLGTSCPQCNRPFRQNIK